MRTEEIQKLHEAYVMPTYAPGLALVKGEGAYVWDADGRRYLDFLSGIAVTNVGHCHPRLSAAIAAQANTLMHVSNLYFNEHQPRLARALSERSLDGKCFFCNSGAEANEALIKLARLWGASRGKYEILSMRNSFHGRTLATLTATGQAKVQKGFDPLPEGFVYSNFNDLEMCSAGITGKTAAILVEAVQGEGGVVPAQPEFLTGLRKLCDEKEMLLLFDEVQCGMGRTGHWFGYQAYPVMPDAIALAKGLGGGFPMGAISVAPQVADIFQPGHHATTFGGTPLACAAALAVIDIIEEERLLENTVAMGCALIEGLVDITRKYSFIREVRGLGLMLGLVLERPAKELEVLLQQKGLITLATAGNVLRLLPPMIICMEQVEEALAILDQGCSECAE